MPANTPIIMGKNSTVLTSEKNTDFQLIGIRYPVTCSSPLPKTRYAP